MIDKLDENKLWRLKKMFPELFDKIHEIINELNKKECSCEKSYPADFDNKHDNPKSAIDEAREYYENECNIISIVNGRLLNQLHELYEKVYEQKVSELNIVCRKNTELLMELTLSRETCEALNEKIRQLENKQNPKIDASKIDASIKCFIEDMMSGDYIHYNKKHQMEIAKKLKEILGISND